MCHLVSSTCSQSELDIDQLQGFTKKSRFTTQGLQPNSAIFEGKCISSLLSRLDITAEDAFVTW